MTTLAHWLIHLLIALGAGPLMLGLVNRTKAFFAGRKGPPLLQVWSDLWRLMRKGMVLSRTTTPVFLLGPAASTIAVILAAAMLPLGHHGPPLSFPGDLILFAYLLALARFFTASAALDTGSPFEGMGAAREVAFAWLAEPALFLGFIALARLTGGSSLAEMLGPGISGAAKGHMGALVMLAVSWFVILLCENSRIPFDDPNTHLELTMIHEVMVLDHSGPALGAILYGSSVKLVVFASLVLGVAAPFSLGPWLDWPVLLAGLAAVSILIGAVESTMARLRLPNVPRLLVSASLLAAFSVVFVMAR
ncbi:MAG: NADH-quinone oxidoreductase subunit H [Planctomycetota bacterium]